MMDTERFKELCALYVTNMLDDVELREFLAVMETNDPKFVKIFDSLKNLTQIIPLSAESVEPSSHIRGNVLESIQKFYPSPKHSFLDRLFPPFGFLTPQFIFGTVLLLIFGICSLIYQNYNTSLLLHQKENQLAELSTKLLKDEAVLQVLAAKNVALVVMNGTEVNTSGFGKILWDQDKSTAILQVSNLPPTSPDKDYQLWIIKDNKPVSNGVFSISLEHRDSYFKITSLVESNSKFINAFAVTLEPKGGVPQPTGKMFLLGSPSKSL